MVARITFIALCLHGCVMAVPIRAEDHTSTAKSGQGRTVVSVRDGAWSNPQTWKDGASPAEGDRVVIRSGHLVEYDVDSDRAIRVLQIAGTLRFRTDRNTRLDVGLIRIERSEQPTEEGFDCLGHMDEEGETSKKAIDESESQPLLQIGTIQNPLDARFHALIRLVPIAGMNLESCPSLVCCGGRVELHGAPLSRTWVNLGETTPEDGNQLMLAEEVSGWRPGQQVIVATTARLFIIGDRGELIPTVETNSETEDRTITAVSGNKLTLDRPLDFRHTVEESYRGEVANLSRNVVIESAQPETARGHTMFHAGSAAAISYAEFRNLGKRGILGRYSLHFHLCRDSMRGSYVVGASIHHSHNRWLTIHGTDYLVVRDCVGYKSVGHGFFLEDGTECFNVLDRNIAVQAVHGEPLPNQVLPFDDNAGAGFWWGNSLNTFTRNAAVECDQYGYRFEMTKTDQFDPKLEVPLPDGSLRSVDVRTLPFVRFEDNEAHSMRRFALNLGGIRHVATEADREQVHKAGGGDLTKIQGGDVLGVGPDTKHPFVIRNFKVWNSQWVFHGGSPCVLIDGLDGYRCSYGIFKTRIDGHEYRKLKLRKIDTPEIFQPWGNTTIQDDYFRYLDPIDDLPPTSVITSVQPLADGRVKAKIEVADNGPIKFVYVNREEATSLNNRQSEWEAIVELPNRQSTIESVTVDAAGNREPRPHRVRLARNEAIISTRP